MLINNKKNNGYLTALTEVNVLEERFATDFKLWQLTKFNKINSYSLQKCLKLVCHLSFKNINFDKKKIIVSLFLLEILSSQKSFLIQSNSNNILLKIRKGSPVGCKVTLRNTKMYEMFDSLALAFTNISTRSFIKISKKMTIYGGRFFCYQIDSFERFFYLSSLVLGEQPRKIDFCWIFNNHIWQESLFYLSSFKLPLNINFKQSWELNKNFNIKINVNKDIKKVSFIEDQNLFYLNKIYFILKESKINLLLNKSTHLRLIENNKLLGKFNSLIQQEIKIPKKYLNLLTFIKNYPLKKGVISGDVVLLTIDKNITAYDLNKLLNQCLKSNEIMPIGLFFENKFLTMKWLIKNLQHFNNNIDPKIMILFLLEMASVTNLFSLLSLNKFKHLNK